MCVHRYILLYRKKPKQNVRHIPWYTRKCSFDNCNWLYCVLKITDCYKFKKNTSAGKKQATVTSCGLMFPTNDA